MYQKFETSYYCGELKSYSYWLFSAVKQKNTDIFALNKE